MRSCQRLGKDLEDSREQPIVSNQVSNQALDEQIRALTSALNQCKAADGKTRELLRSLQQQITRVAEHHEAPVTARLEEIAVRFEADHPAVGTALRQAIDALSKAGI